MSAYKPDHDAKRLLPDLGPYPPSRYRVLYHPDVQLSAEEWLELKDYEKVRVEVGLKPGEVSLQERPTDMTVKIPLHMRRIQGIA